MIKVPKTAGTSLEIALSKYLGDSDVVTRIGKEDENTRRSLGYNGPRNYNIPFRNYRRLDLARIVLRGRRARYQQHSGAFDIKPYLGEHNWDNYFKFAFERNPWDKVISAAWWRGAASSSASQMSKYITSGKLNDVPGFEMYSINNSIAVDKVFLYENLVSALEEICERVRLPELPVMPNSKGSTRLDRRHYREVLSEDARAEISRAYAREIAHFGYKF